MKKHSYDKLKRLVLSKRQLELPSCLAGWCLVISADDFLVR